MGRLGAVDARAAEIAVVARAFVVAGGGSLGGTGGATD